MELGNAAQAMAAETGLRHRAMAGGQMVRGTYRRSMQLASGRFALLQGGREFSLMP